MIKSFLLSLFLHLAILIFFIGTNFISPKKKEVMSRVVIDVELKVEKAKIAKKTAVKKQQKLKEKSEQKLKPKPKPKAKPKKVKKEVKKKPKPKKKPKLALQKKVEKKNVKKIQNKKKLNLTTKKVLKDIKPKKIVVSEKNTKLSTLKKQDTKKNVKIINNVKDSPNKSKTIQNLTDKMTKDELSVLREQIKQCWKVPAGIKNASNLVTKIKVNLKDDGSVIDAKIYNTSISMNSTAMRIMAESAQRAMLSARCNPLKLPKAKYKHWKNIIITFDPKQMLN